MQSAKKQKVDNISRRFDYTLNYSKLDFRVQPELYRVGKGEQGVLLVQPYKQEILPFWRFKTPEEAKISSKEIFKLFKKYLNENDFVGMDMARKFLQMGYTRSRRYANHKSGKKYEGPVPKELRGKSGSHGRKQLPLDVDTEKAKSAEIFYQAWKKAECNAKYAKLKLEWKDRLG